MWVAEMDFPLAPPIRARLHELVDPRLNVGTSRALVREAVRRFAAGLDGAIGE